MYIKKALSVLLVFALAITAAPFLGFTAAYAADGSLLNYEKNDEKTAVTITGCDVSMVGSLTLPDTIEHLPVTAIAAGAFKDCVALTEVTLPKGVTTIGNEAFAHCTSLTTAVLPKSLLSVGNKAFLDCGALNSLVIPKNTAKIGYFAFGYKKVNILQPDFILFCYDDSKGYEYANTSAVYYELIPFMDLTIKTPPVKTTYMDGECFDPAGLTLTVIDSANTEKTVTTGYTYTSAPFSAVGKQTVTVTYGDRSIDVAVTVKPVLTDLDLEFPPNKTIYYLGDTLDTTGLSIVANYSDGSHKRLTEGFTCTPELLSVAGQQAITVTYKGKTTTFEVFVTALTSITVDSLPKKTSYYTGDTLDTTGLAIIANYSDDSQKRLTKGFTCSPKRLSDSDQQTITVTYKGMKTTFAVDVTALTLTKLTLKTPPNKTSYYVGGKLDTTGLSLTAYYNNGAKETVTSGFTCTPTTITAAGKQKVTVKFKNKSVTFEITAKVALVTSIKLNKTTDDISIGSTSKLTAAVSPSYASNKAVTWSSSNTKIATVSSYGVVTGKAVGQVTITCKAKDGSGKTAKCTLRVFPNPPSSAKAVSASFNSIRLTWKAASGVDGYTIYRATSKNGEFKEYTSGNGLRYMDSPLTTGKTYYYFICSYKIVGNKKFFSDSTPILSAKPVPSVPASFTAAKASTTSVKTTWKAVTGASGYEVWMATSSGGNYSRLTTTTKTTYTKTKLTKNKTYYFKARAYKTVNGTRVYGAFTTVKSAKPS